MNIGWYIGSSNKTSPRRWKKEFCWVTPRKSTWNLKITCLKRKTIFQTIPFSFHVNLPGYINPRLSTKKTCQMRCVFLIVFVFLFCPPRNERKWILYTVLFFSKNTLVFVSYQVKNSPVLDAISTASRSHWRVDVEDLDNLGWMAKLADAIWYICSKTNSFGFQSCRALVVSYLEDRL